MQHFQIHYLFSLLITNLIYNNYIILHVLIIYTGVTLDYATLIGELQSCRPKYFQLGVQLGIKPDVIKEWEKNTDNHDCQRCLIEVLSEWLKSRYAEENCWLENLEKALNYIRQTRLAEELRRKYKGELL